MIDVSDEDVLGLGAGIKTAGHNHNHCLCSPNVYALLTTPPEAGEVDMGNAG